MIKSKRSGFSLIELIFVLLIITMGALKLLSDSQPKKLEKDIDDFTATSVSIVKDGILDPYIGYISGSDANCSSTNYFDDITAYRIDSCSKPTNIEMVFDGATEADSKDKTLSYFKFLTAWDNENAGCKVYAGEGNTSVWFDLLYDCSGIESEYVTGIESKMITTMSDNFPYQLKSYNVEALDFTTLSGGNDDDGIVLFHFKI